MTGQLSEKMVILAVILSPETSIDYGELLYICFLQ